MLKFLAAVAVVMIHTSISHKILIMPLLRLAVPIFFIITGYFVGLDTSLIKRALKKAAILFLWVNLFYFTANTLLFNNMSYSMSNGFANHHLLVNLATQGNAMCTVMWYVNALIGGLLLVYGFYRLLGLKCLYIAACIAFCANIILGPYSFLVPFELNASPWHLTRNALLTAMPCLTAGIMIRRTALSRLSLRSSLILTLSLLVLAYVEYVLFYQLQLPISDIYLFTIPLAASIFILCLNLPRGLVWLPLSFLGKHLSRNIFIFHIFIDSLLMFWPVYAFTLAANQALIAVPATITFTLLLYYIGNMLKFSNKFTIFANN